MISNAGQATLVHQYKANMLKRKLVKIDIWFNNECLRKHITPRYISLHTRANSWPARKAVRAATVIWIREEVKKHYFKLNLIEQKLKLLYLRLTCLLHPAEWDSLVSSVLNFVADKGAEKFSRVQNKIASLMLRQKGFSSHSHQYNSVSSYHLPTVHNSTFLPSSEPGNVDPGNTSSSFSFDNTIFESEFNTSAPNNNNTNLNPIFPFHQRFLNLSSYHFSTNEENLLSLGLKYNFHKNSNASDLEMLAVSCQNTLEFSRVQDSDMISSRISVILNDSYNSNAHSDIIHTNLDKSLKSLRTNISNNNLIISKADKGNCIVVLDRVAYVDKVTDFLQNGDFTLLNNNPTQKFITQLRRHLNDNNDILQELGTNKYKLNLMNASTPVLYGLPKIHKPNVPIRPVVSYFNSPCAKLSRFLNSFILNSTNFISSSSIKNSKHLSSLIKDIHIPDSAILVSFDVTNLFPSVPPEDCLQLVSDLLLSHNFTPDITEFIVSLVDFVLKQNFFQFNNCFYRQNTGLAMGSNLSPLLAEIFMDNLEKNIKNCEFYSDVLFYYRYVDDIILCYNNTIENLNLFKNHIDSLHPSIKFTIELEQGGSIPFLDLLVSKTQNNKLSFSIYRKATTTDTVIPFSSNHPYNQKCAAFNALFNRLFSIPMNKDGFNKELNIIKQIATGNGYPPNFTNKLFFNHFNKMVLNKNLYSPPDNNHNFFSIPYLGSISHKIKSLFMKHNINICFKTNNSLGSSIVNSKDRIPLFERSGIYRLNCSQPGCSVCYIGQCGRKVSLRVQEHIREIDKHSSVPKDLIQSKSSFADHILKEKHTFDPKKDVLMLHNCAKGPVMNLLEILEINKALRNPQITCVNEQVQFSCLKFFNSLGFSFTSAQASHNNRLEAD